jgi:hypothetical protein
VFISRGLSRHIANLGSAKIITMIYTIEAILAKCKPVCFDLGTNACFNLIEKGWDSFQVEE